MTMTPTTSAPWKDTTAHKTASALLVLACATVIGGLFLPWIRGAGVTGADITLAAVRAAGKLTGNASEIERAPSALVELVMIVIVNGLCIGLSAIACAYALLKCAIARRSATRVVAIPVLLAFVSLVYAVARVASFGTEGEQLLRAVFSLASARSGNAVEPATGFYLYMFGMLAVLLISTVMYRVERHALKRASAAATLAT